MANRMTAIIEKELAANLDLVSALCADHALHRHIEAAVHICSAAFGRGNKMLLAGNGGSAADAQHWAGELVNRFNFDRPGLPAIALTTDTSILTATANDYGYEHVFARQVEALGRRGDVLCAISTSGHSRNILRAIDAAHATAISVIGFTGRTGGAMAEQCDLCFHMPSDETSRIQEGHEIVGHLICNLIERECFALEPERLADARCG